MSDNATTAPKERINIVYKPATGNQQEQVELPLKLLILGDFKGGESENSIEEREVINVDGASLDSVIESIAPSLQLTVKDKLGDDPEAEVDLQLDFKSMADFHPDNLVHNFPALEKLMELRDALRALKGPLGNVSQFRRHLEEVVQDEKARGALLKELNVSTADKGSAPAKK